MLRVIDTIEPQPDLRVGVTEYQPFHFDWKHSSPVAWWSVDTENAYYLMVGYEMRGGRIISFEMPLYREVVRRETPCWTERDVDLAHPVVAIEGLEWQSTPDPFVKSFTLEYSNTDVKARWGDELKCMRSGRCMFGLDGSRRIVSVGVVELSTEEFARLHLGLTWPRESTRGTDTA